MPSQQDINFQQDLLATHRRRLESYLKRQAQLGTAHIPPEIDLGIAEARNDIQRVKMILREWGGVIEDLPEDEELTRTSFLENTSINVLYVSASPFVDLNVDPSRKYKIIQRALSDSVFNNKFKLHREDGVEYFDMQRILLQYIPDIIHFNVPASPNVGLYFDDCKPAEGRVNAKSAYSGHMSTRATIPALVTLFKSFRSYQNVQGSLESYRVLHGSYLRYPCRCGRIFAIETYLS